MTEMVLKNADEALLGRIDRIARHRGWDTATTLIHLLERGLHGYEDSGEVRFESCEAAVLRAAVEAMNDVPDDPGFAMIGRAGAAGPAAGAQAG